jgi:hypothetical protein
MKMILNIFFLFLITSVFSQTSDEKLMMIEINRLRSNPTSYIKVIEDFKKMKTSTTIGGLTVTRKSNVDWVKECDEAINFLKTAKPVDTLTFDKDFYNKLNNFNFVGEHTHLNTNGAENIVPSNSVTYGMALLLIDANVSGKEHRINLMNPKAKKVAVKKFVYNNQTYFVQDFIN